MSDRKMGAKTTTLTTFLDDWALGGATRGGIAKTVLALAGSSIEISELVAKGRLAGSLSEVTARAGEFDEQKEIDLRANQSIVAALQDTPVAALASEEAPEPIVLNDKAPLLVATDPLDGSSNVDANVSFGMIFSILPRHPSSTGEAAFLRPGSHQLAAGIIVYGPTTVLALTVGNGTNIFTLDRAAKSFMLTNAKVAVPAETSEYAPNFSYGGWQPLL